MNKTDATLKMSVRLEAINDITMILHTERIKTYQMHILKIREESRESTFLFPLSVGPTLVRCADNDEFFKKKYTMRKLTISLKEFTWKR